MKQPASRDAKLLPATSRLTRVLVVSALIPKEGSGGGCLTMQRHFVLNKDFDFAIAAARGDFSDNHLRFHIRRNRLVDRLRRGPAQRLIRNCEYLWNWVSVPQTLIDFASDFRPDVIFSIVDDWHMGLSWRLSKILRVPLAVNFQDLFAVSKFEARQHQPFPVVRSFLLNRYRFLNDRADVVFHVGEEMREWFGDRGRGDILFPIADPGGTVAKPRSCAGPKPFRVVYAGNCSGAYGRMMYRLAEAALSQEDIDLKIYTRGSSWNSEQIQRMEQAGIYQGFRPFKELQQHLDAADAYLVAMSFEQNNRIFMETSFNTKWVDYVARGRPVFVWGPNYSSANRFATKYRAADTIESDDASSVLSHIAHELADPARYLQLSSGAASVASNQLNPGRLQELLVNQLRAGIASFTANASLP